jgi:hypothetical protein
MHQRRFPKIFGIGLPKTGTTTLGAMLKRLGYNHAPYDFELIGRVADGEMAGLSAQIGRYDSFEDWPWPAVYQAVDAAAPGSAFVMTLRKDGATWLESAQKHQRIKSSAGIARPGPASRLSRQFIGPYNVFDHPEKLIEFYRSHRDGVRRHFRDRPEQLIEVCWETGSGWRELCTFLGHPIVEDGLPHENSSETRARRAAWLPRKVRRLMHRIGA